MEYPMQDKLPFEEIGNGALILLLLKQNKTWEALCSRYAYTDPAELEVNTSTMSLLQKLYAMRELGLVRFEDTETEQGRKPVGEISETGLSSQIRVAFGGMSLAEVALVSRHSKGMAVAPMFGRPREPEKPIDIFVLMPFKAKMEGVYKHHLKKLGEELGLHVTRADETLSARPFMEKVWDGICAARLVLADCTEKNPNVFYEIGIAHAVGKKVLLITRSAKDVPSDIEHFDYVPYTYDPEGVEILLGRLKAFIKSHFKR